MKKLLLFFTALALLSPAFAQETWQGDWRSTSGIVAAYGMWTATVEGGMITGRAVASQPAGIPEAFITGEWENGAVDASLIGGVAAMGEEAKWSGTVTGDTADGIWQLFDEYGGVMAQGTWSGKKTGNAPPPPPAGAACGNGVAEAGEDCDKSDLNGQTCTSLGYASGKLSCRLDCTFDVRNCKLATPVNTTNQTLPPEPPQPKPWCFLLPSLVLLAALAFSARRQVV